MFTLRICNLFVAVLVVMSLWVEAFDDRSMDGALKYLRRYGYLDGVPNPSHMSLSDLRSPLLAFQKMSGLNLSGYLDEETVELMKGARCGNKDLELKDRNTSASDQHSSRFRLVGTKWENRQIKYRITHYSRQRISTEIIDRQIEKAFQIWAKHVDLQFIRMRNNGGPVDIEIGFTEGNHGDRFPFWDSTQLAHAFYPGEGLGGDVHMNDAVDWSHQNTLLYTLTHEIGHALGLGHSSSQESIMYSHLLSVKEELELHSDDIAGIQEIYGGLRPSHPSIPPPPPTTTTTAIPTTTRRVRPLSTSTTPQPAPTTTEVEMPGSGHICEDGKIDAITALDNGDILFFKGEYVHIVQNVKGVLTRQSPRLIKELFSNRLPTHIDAAFSRGIKTYFLKGNLYWRSIGLTIDEGYPKEISRHLSGVPNNVDAAFVGSDNQLYFLKGSKYWKLNPGGKRRQSFDHEIEFHWKGIPTRDIDAVFRSPNGITYFFKDENYWRFNETTNAVPLSQPPYPRDSRKWWFSCQNF